MQLLKNSLDQDLLDVISAARKGDLDEVAIASLARTLAASGETLEAGTSRTADVASTGGPTSLSTLLCPLFLRSFGWTVPKLGVPGRPAGGLDVLSRIPGYQTELAAAGVKRMLQECGYAHFAAGDKIAPLDARLFALRQQHGAQHIPALVIASLLSKKIAVGVKTIGLDVRVAPHGNFGSDVAAARENARLFCRVAAILGLNATCILTDASKPYQPYIGRGESLLALFRFFTNEPDHWLRRHADQCAWMSAAAVGLPPIATKTLPAFEVFVSNVEAQGGSMDGFKAMAVKIAGGHRFSVTAPKSGFPIVDLDRVRTAITARQKKSVDDGAYPDPAGVILLVEETLLVEAGVRRQNI